MVSTKSLKSNGSGPYCVPVGSGTGTSKSSGSNGSASWYQERRGNSLAEESSAPAKHLYENFETNDGETKQGGVTRAIVHQESFENEAFLNNHEDSVVSDGSDSPPFDCNKTLLSSKSDRTMWKSILYSRTASSFYVPTAKKKYLQSQK